MNLSNRIPISNGVYSRDDVDFVYIPITRCGSTWLRRVFAHNNFYVQTCIENLSPLDTFPNLKDKIKLIIMRDPLERLISGMYAPEDFDLDTIYDRSKIFNNFAQDVHTCPQICFLNGVPLDNTVFIKYGHENRWDLQVKKFLNEHVPNFEVGPSDWDPTVIGTSPKHLLDVARNNKEIYNNLMEYLEEDQKFFEQVRWHGTN